MIPAGGVEGVIVAEADHLGGFSLFVDDGKLTHTYSMMGVFVFRQKAEEDLPDGEVTVRMEFAADEPKPATGGEVTLFIGDRAVGEGRMDHTVPIRFSGYAGMDIGRDNGGVVDLTYEEHEPFEFTGTIKKVVFESSPRSSKEERMHSTRRTTTDTPRTRCRRDADSPEETEMKLHDTIDVLIGGYMSKDAAEEDCRTGLRLRGRAAGNGAHRQGPRRRAVGRTNRPHGAGGRGHGGPWSGRPRGRACCSATPGDDGNRGRAWAQGLASSFTTRPPRSSGEQAGETIPLGGAGLIVVYSKSEAEKVEPAVSRAIKQVKGEAEGRHVEAVKGALADAQERMSEESA